MKKIIRNKINSKGFNLGKATSKEEVIELIKSLKPYNIGIDLVRLGPNSDSGYLVPDDLNNIEACFSPGCDNKFNFEEDCIKRGMKVFIADKTVEKENVPDKFEFIEKFVNPTPKKGFLTMDQWVNNSNLKNDSDLLLQMDIEGDEYQNLLNISDKLLDRFRIIVIEFHDLEMLFDSYFFRTAFSAFSRLLKNHTCVHIHPNNNNKIITINNVSIPPMAEFTFIRNDRFNTVKTAVTKFPNKLDMDCIKELDSVLLPKIWFEQS